MMRSIPFDKLPNGFKKQNEIGTYEFFTNSDNDIIWKRKDKPMFILNKSLNTIPTDHKKMFWYDSKYYEDFIKKSITFG